MKIKAGSRTSRLAMWQAERVATLLEAAHADLEVEIIGMSTLGDEIRDKPVPEIGGKGLFTERLERALLAEEIDLAVHSLKDLPTRLPEGLAYAGSPPRANPTDAFVSHTWDAFEEVPGDGIVATGSRRRRAQLRAQKPGLTFKDLRGNIGTRLQKLEDYGWDGIVMATAALERLEMLETVTTEFDPTEFPPAPSQGAMGIEIVGENDEIREILAKIVDQETTTACGAERTFMRILEGGCTVPLGAYCQREDDVWAFYGWVGEPAGDRIIADQARGEDPVELAETMARDFIDRGAQELLAE